MGQLSNITTRWHQSVIKERTIKVNNYYQKGGKIYNIIDNKIDNLIYNMKNNIIDIMIYKIIDNNNNNNNIYNNNNNIYKIGI